MHPKCVVLADKFKNLKVWDLEGVDDLSEEERKEISKTLKIPMGTKDKRVKHLPKVNVRPYKPVEKFEDQKTLLKKEWTSYKSNISTFEGLTIPKLKDVL